MHSQYAPLVLVSLVTLASAADYVHNPIHYHSQNDKGAYNFGYDTGLFGSHQFHQETKQPDGSVTGRYGYTDPDGKLRLVYYRAGKETGYEIIKDVASDSEASSASYRKPVPSPKDSHTHVHQVDAHVRFQPEPKWWPGRQPSPMFMRRCTPFRPMLSTCTIRPLPKLATILANHRYHDSHSSSAASARYVEKVSPRRVVVSEPVITKVSQPREPKVLVVQEREHTKTLYSPIEALRGKASPRSGPAPVKGTVVTPAQYPGRYPAAGRYSRCWCE
ncbi:hypothetical protein HDE_04482 [Halotydeus destructor]|nr:hypothetical protein HDE_04482 [Halotydeus destructor]